MAVIEMRGGGEEAFLADLALEGAGGQVRVRLAGGLPLDPGKAEMPLDRVNFVSYETICKRDGRRVRTRFAARVRPRR